MRVVIDTNDYISALIGKRHRVKLERVLLDPFIDVLADLVLMGEITEVAYREKFRKYVSIAEVEAYLEMIQRRTKPVRVTSKVLVSSDPDDNFLLELALDGQADYLVTGDKSDLLVLKEFNGIPIIRLDTLLEIVDQWII